MEGNDLTVRPGTVKIEPRSTTRPDGAREKTKPRLWEDILRHSDDLPDDLEAPEGDESVPSGGHRWWYGQTVVAQSGDKCREGSWVFLEVPAASTPPISEFGPPESQMTSTALGTGAAGQGQQGEGPNLQVGRIKRIVVPATGDGTGAPGQLGKNTAVIIERYSVLNTNDFRTDMPVLTPCSGESGMYSIFSAEVCDDKLEGCNI